MTYASTEEDQLEANLRVVENMLEIWFLHLYLIIMFITYIPIA